LLRVAQGSRNRAKGPKLVFRAEDVGADKLITLGVCVVPRALFGHAEQCGGVFCSRWVSHSPDVLYITLPTTEMFCTPFAELLELMY
jgi:hypothetical protein